MRAIILSALLLTWTTSLLVPQQPTPSTTNITISQGPVVESVSPRSAVIAWSTNVSAGTVVRFGTDPNHLDARKEMPWGGYTHRVVLQNLQSDTVYYFQVMSPHAEGSGATVESPVLQFTTKL